MSRSSNLIFPTVLLLVGGVSYGSVISANRLAVEAGFPFIAYAFWQMIIASGVLVIISTVLGCPPRMGRRYLRVYAITASFGCRGLCLS